MILTSFCEVSVSSTRYVSAMKLHVMRMPAMSVMFAVIASISSGRPLRVIFSMRLRGDFTRELMCSMGL